MAGTVSTSTPRRLVLFFAAILLAQAPAELQAAPATTKTEAAGRANQACLDCHSDPDLKPESERGKTLKLTVPADALTGSVHEDLRCSDCHSGATTFEEAPHNQGKPLTLRCDGCHSRAAEEYQAGIHALVRAKSVLPPAPWCHDCHGDHHILPLHDQKSVLSPLKQPNTCGKCHANDQLAPNEDITKRRLIERYFSSVHWQAVKEGKPAATCSDCHGRHTVLPSSDPSSLVNRLGLLHTCAKCHQDIVTIFSDGSHGRALLHGNLDVPTCTTCHGDHDMMSLRTQPGQSRNFAGTEVCMWCHGNARMMARYALDTTPVESYLRDFHGLTQRGTAGTSATCADCHDAHHALPSSHPQSRMHISNRGTVCGKCHGQTSESFIMSFTHKAKAVEQGADVKQVVVAIYLALIFVTIGGMLLHNGIIWFHSFRRKYRFQKQNPMIVRLNRFEKSWHWVLLVSFFVLALTGFALKFPESPVFSWLYSLGMTEGARAAIHRLAASVLTANFLAFLVYQVVTKPGRKWLGPMMPRWRDLKDFVATMRYHLGFRRERPRYSVFNYTEKAEYWALVWGTLIMLATGLVLWFPKSLPASWPSWLIEVSRAIHFYEALLASLAIVVWHFFNTIFRQEEYPMDTSWLTGVLTEDEARNRFTDEAIEAQIPPPPKLEKKAEPLEKPRWNKDE